MNRRIQLIGDVYPPTPVPPTVTGEQELEPVPGVSVADPGVFYGDQGPVGLHGPVGMQSTYGYRDHQGTPRDYMDRDNRHTVPLSYPALRGVSPDRVTPAMIMDGIHAHIRDHSIPPFVHDADESYMSPFLDAQGHEVRFPVGADITSNSNTLIVQSDEILQIRITGYRHGVYIYELSGAVAGVMLPTPAVRVASRSTVPVVSGTTLTVSENIARYNNAIMHKAFNNFGLIVGAVGIVVSAVVMWWVQ